MRSVNTDRWRIFLLFAATELLEIQHPLPGASGAPDELQLGNRGRTGPIATEQRVRGFKLVSAADQSGNAETRQERVRFAIVDARGRDRRRGIAERRERTGRRHVEDFEVLRRVVAAVANSRTPTQLVSVRSYGRSGATDVTSRARHEHLSL